MVYDKVENIEKYAGISMYIPKVINYLKNNDCAALTPGSYSIEGDRCFVLCQSFKTMPADEGRFEFHRKYIDLQIVLEGIETCYIDYVSDIDAFPDYNPEKDICFYQHNTEGSIILRPGLFAIFEPNDGHFPDRIYGNESGVGEKLCFKMMVE